MIMLLHEFLQGSAERSPDKVALVAGGRRFTFRALASSASGLAIYLTANGLQRGDRVAVYLDNCVEAVISIFGILQAGGCFVVVHHTAPPERLGFILNHCSARFLIAPHHRLANLHRAREACSAPPHLIVTGDDAGQSPLRR